MVRGRSGIARR